MGLNIRELFVEYQKEPIGLDERKPRFSWILESDETKVLQSACWIRVVERETGKEVWDSGQLFSDVSTGISYEGAPLLPCREYEVQVEIQDQYGNRTKKKTWFETGFLKDSLEAWDGAEWIGSPEYCVCAKNRGVFILETEFRLEPGSRRAGVVFGAGDYRLLDHRKNELGIEGENYIRYEINLSDREKATLDIYRVGYAPEDRKDVPFVSVPLVNAQGEEKHPVITKENAEKFHTLRIEVEGNCAYAYVDDVRVDAVTERLPWGTITAGRMLNPRGRNDVLTYPHLNEIGFFAGEGDRAYFKYLKVRNMRCPANFFIWETPEGNLDGQKSLFHGKVSVEDGCFVMENGQITADPSHTSIPMFRSNFTVKKEKKLKKARLYLTSRGIYECRVNGKKITERLLPPGLTQYDKRLNYQTYDITEKLNSGKNSIGVTLSSGWWSDAQTFVVKNYNFFGDRESFLAKMLLTYEDGTEEVFVTNTEDWKYYGEGPYLYAGLFQGECFDGRKAELYETYSRADFDDRTWKNPVKVKPVRIEESRTFPGNFGRPWPTVNDSEPKLLGEYDAPVYVVEERCARTRREIEPGVYLYDLKQEMAGVPRITFHKEEEGTVAVIRYAEVLYPDLPEYQGNEGKIMVENYRDAGSTDFYICGGREEECYQPKFTFHGYRYIEISGIKNPPKPEEVVSLQYSSIREFQGSFQSSHPLLNRFAENVKWSQKCNFINIPTDCPQRNERMGWAGDTHVFCHTALQNAPLKQFYERNLQAMRDLQTEKGQFPAIAPIGGGFGGLTYECATFLIAWELYQQYGDVRTLETCYPSMKRYLHYLEDQGMLEGGDFEKLGMLGDWLAPEETDLSLMGNAFYYRILFLLEKIAGILKQEEDRLKYEELASKVKAFWNETYIDRKTGRTCAKDGTICDTQCSYVLALEYGVAEDRKNAGRQLLRKVQEKKYTVGTGFFGTGLLNLALTDIGATEEAYKLMLQTAYPSWLYPVTQGATSIWEHWDSYTEEKGFGGQNAMNSFNHYSLGSVLSWMYQVILGIRRDEEQPGYRHFMLKPEIGPLDFAKGSISVPQGIIRAGWKKENGQVIYVCEIPVNTTATLYFPDGRKEELGSGTYERILKEKED